jgi:hypothetical protein
MLVVNRIHSRYQRQAIIFHTVRRRIYVRERKLYCFFNSFSIFIYMYIQMVSLRAIPYLYIWSNFRLFDSIKIEMYTL